MPLIHWLYSSHAPCITHLYIGASCRAGQATERLQRLQRGYRLQSCRGSYTVPHTPATQTAQPCVVCVACVTLSQCSCVACVVRLDVFCDFVTLQYYCIYATIMPT